MFEELHLASEWVGQLPLEVPLFPVWGKLTFWISLLGGNVLLNLKLLSFVFYILDGLLVFFTVRNFFSIAVKRAERQAIFEEAHYEGLESIAATISTLAFLVTPAFATAAFSVSPIFVAIFFSLLALFFLSLLVKADKIAKFYTFVFLAGLFSSAGLWHGIIGVAYFPLILLALISPPIRKGIAISQTCLIALVGFILGAATLPYFVMSNPLSDSIRIIAISVHSLPWGLFFPGSIVCFLLMILPLFTIFNFTMTGRIRPIVLRRGFFGVWGFAVGIAFVAAVASIVIGEKSAGEKFVDGVLDSLGSRKVVISDGAFDDLLRFKLPKDVILVSLEADADVPSKLISEISDEDVKFAADLGSRAFVEEWLLRVPNAVEKAIIISAIELPTHKQSHLIPLGWCWSGTTIEKKINAVELYKRYWQPNWNKIAGSVQGNSATKWYMRRVFAVQGMKIASLLEATQHRKEAEEIKNFIAKNIDASFSAEEVRRKMMDRARLASSVQKLVELDNMNEYAKAERIFEIEDSIIPELERSIGDEASWLIHVYKGELALKKGAEFREVARDEYRAAAVDYHSDLNAVAGKLLILDANLRDEEGTYKDALGILRRDRKNKMAAAIMGNMAAMNGDNEKAEKYLRRAVEGEGLIMLEPLNDLAEVLARRGKLDEAREISDKVMSANDGNWNFVETHAAILLRLGNLEEGEKALLRAQELAKAAGQYEIAKNILDIDRARVLKLKENGLEYRVYLRSLKERKMSAAHRRLLEEL